jgi:hypothetical protein
VDICRTAFALFAKDRLADANKTKLYFQTLRNVFIAANIKDIEDFTSLANEDD